MFAFTIHVTAFHISCSEDQVQFCTQPTSSKSGTCFDIERVGLNGDSHATEQLGPDLLEPSTNEEADLPVIYFENVYNTPNDTQVGLVRVQESVMSRT